MIQRLLLRGCGRSVGIGACMHVCVWYTELTCISNWASKTDIVVGKTLCVCVCVQSRLVYRIGPLERTLWVRSSTLLCVDRWRGHSRCRAPLTTGVDIYPRVLPSAYCVLVAGPLPLQGALNHWGRILPQGPTIQNQRTFGPVNAHLISWPSKAQNIQNLENIW